MLEAFIAQLPQASWNEWWRRLLGAESALMLGDLARAIDQARTAARLTSGRSSLPESVYIRMLSARVLAWAGALDESVALLDTLAHEYPGVGPAAIVRDPFFTTPLARNAHWQTLERTLNAEIAAIGRASALTGYQACKVSPSTCIHPSSQNNVEKRSSVGRSQACSIRS